MAPYMDDISGTTPAEFSVPAQGPAAGGDELDDLFNYDAGLDDVFRDFSPPRANTKDGRESNSKSRQDVGLGIDEEVEIVRKIRVPRVKLDEDRLLSQAGIPKLRSRAKELRFKGKGHEYSDAARLLQLYQLWLDDLFPKARFMDALKMVEKEGHKRRLQVMRQEWINEGKPRVSVHEDSILNDPVAEHDRNASDSAVTSIAPIFENATGGRPKTPTAAGGTRGEQEDDIYNATPIANRTKAVAADGHGDGPLPSIFGPGKAVSNDEPEDDLDALMAEAEMQGVERSTSATRPAQIQVEPDFDDEMEAMADMGW